MMKYDRQAFVVYRDIKEKLPEGWGRPLVKQYTVVCMLFTRDTRPRTKSDINILSLVSKAMYVQI